MLYNYGINKEGGQAMGGNHGNYEKGLYNQLMEVMGKLDALTEESTNQKRELKCLTGLTNSLSKENADLKEELGDVKNQLASVNAENTKLRIENGLLRDDNERMRRILNNNSQNSSLPPSTDEKPTKSANTYNSRPATNKKAGAQPGHTGRSIAKSEVENKIKNGEFAHKIVEVGDAAPGRNYITRYKLDLEIGTLATEYRIYADENGKFNIPKELTADVFYGESIKAMVAFLYSEGIVANDRICTFINSISGDTLNLSEGSVYNFCRRFGKNCESVCNAIEDKLLNSHEICTDATVVSTDGIQSYVRNFSTEDYVLYYSSDKKDLKTLRGMSVLKRFAGIFTHDHETALYHFGTGHSDCNVHLGRYLTKNTEETGNSWSKKLSDFLLELNKARNLRIAAGIDCFTEEELRQFDARYDEILAEGETANPKTKNKLAKQEEQTLLNRLRKYKPNHLLFLRDFRVHFSDNISEKDLRIIKGRQKMAGGFRKASGREMYCKIISFVETIKRQKRNIYQSIIALLMGKPVIR